MDRMFPTDASHIKVELEEWHSTPHLFMKEELEVITTKPAHIFWSTIARSKLPYAAKAGMILCSKSASASAAEFNWSSVGRQEAAKRAEGLCRR